MSLFATIFPSEGRKRETSNAHTQSLFSEDNVYRTAPKQQTSNPRGVSSPTPAEEPASGARPLDEQQAARDERTVFVGNLALSVKQLPKKLKRHFAAYGEVESVRLRSIPSKTGERAPKRVVAQSKRFKEGSSCNAYIVFKQRESAESAQALNLTQFYGNPIRVDMAGGQRFQKRRQGPSDAPGHFTAKDSIFVKNLDKEVTDSELCELFNDGTLAPLCREMVRNWRIVRDHQTGESMGYAFVAFKKRNAAKAALVLDGYVLGKRKISVQPLQPKPHTQPQRGFVAAKPASRAKRVQKRRSWGGVQTKGRFKQRGS